MGMEIERKFLINEIPSNLEQYSVHIIEQAYLNIYPAIRIRRDGDTYYMTYKGVHSEDGIGQVEYNLPLYEPSYKHLLEKADGRIIRKKRYIVPINEDAYEESFLEEHPDIRARVKNGGIRIELDIFADSAPAPFEGLVLAEIEFPSEEAAAAYCPASWFKEEVTGRKEYSNAYMSGME